MATTPTPTIVHRTPKAAKSHECGHCGYEIRKGEHYNRYIVLGDRGLVSVAIHDNDVCFF